jgi:hypothetical protein
LSGRELELEWEEGHEKLGFRRWIYAGGELIGCIIFGWILDMFGGDIVELKTSRVSASGALTGAWLRIGESSGSRWPFSLARLRSQDRTRRQFLRSRSLSIVYIAICYLDLVSAHMNSSLLVCVSS